MERRGQFFDRSTFLIFPIDHKAENSRQLLDEHYIHLTPPIDKCPKFI